MLDLTRHTDATVLNRILNEPAVRPWVADHAEGVLDLSARVADQNNVLLMGEHGGCLFVQILPGVYELHTQVLPAGRGKWTADLGTAAAHWMFTRTEAHELLTRVPNGHIGAKAAALAAGAKHEFSRDRGIWFMGKQRTVHVYALRIHDWILAADHLVERGREFHEFLESEAKRLGMAGEVHADDPAEHFRHVGACLEMGLAGQLHKATFFYNRWAIIARHRIVRLVSVTPPVIEFDMGLLRLEGGRLEVVPWAASQRA